MTPEAFQEVFEHRLKLSREILIRKAGEYAPGSDRFSNFKTAAAYLGCTPEKALLGIWSKHLVAIRDFVEIIEDGGEIPLDWWQEKLGDSVNYLILLEGMVMERAGFGHCTARINETTEQYRPIFGLGEK